MHLFINVGLPLSIHIGRVFVFETDFTQTIFVRLPFVGDIWKSRGYAASLDPWSKVRGTTLEAMPFIL